MSLFRQSDHGEPNRAVVWQMVTLCCNDDFGNESGQVTHAHIHGDDGDTEVELETSRARNMMFDDWGPVCRYESYERKRSPSYAIGRLRVGRITMPVYGYRSWVGNIFWDGFALAPKDVRRLVTYLIERSGFTVSMAVCDSEWLPPHLRDAPPSEKSA